MEIEEKIETQINENNGQEKKEEVHEEEIQKNENVEIKEQNEKVEYIEKEKTENKERDILKEKRVKTKNSKKNLIYLIISISILLIATILSTGFAFLNLSNKNIISGIKIRNIDVQGFSKEQAIANLKEILNEEQKNEIKIKVNNNDYTITAEQIEIEYKIEEAVNNAYEKGRINNIFVNNFNIIKSMIKGINIDLPIQYNEELLNKKIEEINYKIDGAVIESTYCIENDELIITKGKKGLSIDTQMAKETIINSIKTGNNQPIILEANVIEPQSINIEKIHKEVYRETQDAYYVENPYQLFTHIDGIDFDIEEAKEILQEEKDEYIIKLTITKPEITVNKLEAKAFPHLLATCSTIYDESNVSRSTNLKLAAAKINGEVVSPGETFSYNGTVGKRTVEAGYKDAAGYQGGKIVQMLGGGICQVSSTLYCATIYANLNVTERYNHMFETSYIDVGKDATVVYGSLDFKFENTRKFPIRIEATAYSGLLKISIYGVKEDIEYEVNMETTILEYIPYSVIYENDATLDEGYEEVTQWGWSGCKTITYKVLKLNGVEVSRSVLSSDTYDPMNKYITKGTKKKTIPTSTETINKQEKTLEENKKTNTTTNTETNTSKENKTETNLNKVTNIVNNVGN